MKTLCMCALGLLAWMNGSMTATGEEPVQDQAASTAVTLEIRVLSIVPGGKLLVDRGVRDGVNVGDRVWVQPKGSLPREGSVVAVRERESEVGLIGSGGLPEPGSRGLISVVLITPETKAPLVVEGLDEVAPLGADATKKQRPRWERSDDDWDSSQPLLARVRSERPEERPRVIGGRVYVAGGGASTLDGKRGNGYLRSGFDAFVMNPFGRGGQLDMDMELDLRTSFVPGVEGNDDGRARLRFDQLSYTWGGTRFETESHQVGRFLLRTTPEFGRLDGYEWTRRLSTGDRLGASVGYLVENRFDSSTGNQFGVQAFYRWILDRRELVGVTGAIQKTFRNGAKDRERALLKADAAPDSGLGPWALHASIAYDLLSNEDTFETKSGEFSRAWMQAWRDMESSVPGRTDDISITYRHEGFVQTLGSKLPPLFAAGLVAEKSDRVGVRGSFWMSPDQRFFYAAGVWKDSEESGGDVEAGLGLEDLGRLISLERGGRGDLRLFASNGRSSSTIGFGASYGRVFEEEAGMGWDLSYELLWNDRLGFTNDVDTTTQHRLRYIVDLGRFGEWRLSGNADFVAGGSDLGLSTGFFLTRSF